MYFSVNNNFATWQHGQENDPDFIFSLGSLAPRSLALEVFKSRILLLLQLPHPLTQVINGCISTKSHETSLGEKRQSILVSFVKRGRLITVINRINYSVPPLNQYSPLQSSVLPDNLLHRLAKKEVKCLKHTASDSPITNELIK